MKLSRKKKSAVVPEEVEALFRAYTQMGQSLPQTEGQIRALAQSLLREKAITRLVELTTEPEIESSEEEESVETPAESIETVDVVDEVETGDTQEAEEDSQPVLSDDETGEVEQTSDAKSAQTGSEKE